MVQSINLFSIFVASPSDVKSERETLERVVRELNMTIGPMRNARFDLVRWETHSYPAAASDAQDAINKQLGSDHDIVVGIFWGRVGTPTPRATSGTIEELERALERKRSNPDSVEIMVYLKDDGLPPSEMDGHQLTKLSELRASLASLGILHKKFLGSEFESHIRVDLTRVLHQCIERASVANSTISSALTESSTKLVDVTIGTNQEDEDAGIDDLFEEAAQSLSDATGLMAALTQLADDTSNQMNTLNDSLLSSDPQISRDALSSLALVLGTYGMEARSITAQMDARLAITFSRLTRALVMAMEDRALPESESRPLLENLRGYRGSFQTLVTTVSGVETIYSSLPRRTKAINQSRRHAVEASRFLIDKLRSWIRMAESVETMLVNVQESTLDQADRAISRD